MYEKNSFNFNHSYWSIDTLQRLYFYVIDVREDKPLGYISGGFSFVRKLPFVLLCICERLCGLFKELRGDS